VISPTPRAIALAAALFPIALLPALVHPRLFGLWIVAAGLVAAALGLDALLGVPAERLGLELEAPKTLAVGEPGSATAVLRSPRAIRALELLVECHADFAPPPPFVARLEAATPARVAIPLVARRRGKLSIDEAWLRWTGPLGLARRRKRVALRRPIAVVPDLHPVRAAALRFVGSREITSGAQVERFVGDGSEFDALVEYVPGLDHRAISWRASARHRKLLCQEFRAERNHQVILALDTGHLMSEPLAGLPRLDHAVTSALLLSWASLRMGDRVGLFGFDRAARAWAEPQGGMGAFPRLKALTASLDYSTAETNFTLGLTELSARLRRRSLVVVFTEFVDTVTAELMVENLTRLARRQLVLFVALRDPALDAVASARPRRVDDVYRSVVASDFVRERERVMARLRRVGVQCVDAAPAELSSRLLNRYLDIKRRELIA